VKLLVDEMFPAQVAIVLRERHGVDAISVRERPDLAGHADVDVFAAAQVEGRAVVTENVRDFRPIARQWEADGKVHHGLVLTSNRRFPRARPRTLGRLIAALAMLTSEVASEEPTSMEAWL
jgi:predicted nuclease of predicted toxin-antitoxin system